MAFPKNKSHKAFTIMARETVLLVTEGLPSRPVPKDVNSDGLRQGQMS